MNPYYDALPGHVQTAMDRFAALTGRQYKLFDYFGAADADRVIVLMGSGAETARETIEHLNARGARLGLVQVHLFRPFSGADLLDAIPSTARSIAVLDRTKEPGAPGEPLYQDVVTAFAEAVGTGRSRRHAPHRRRPLRPVVEGVHARDGQGGVRQPRGARAEEPLHRRHQRRRVAHQPRLRPARSSPRPRTSSAASSTASARTAPSARTRTRSRSSARRPPATRRATSSTTRRSPDRRRSRTCASGRGRFARRISSSAPASSPATSSSSSSRSRCCARPTDGAVFLLNSPFGPDRGLGRAAAPHAGGPDPQADPSLRHRRRHGGGRRRHGGPRQHDHADLLLRDLRRAAARGGDPEDQGAPSRRPTARKAASSSSRTSRPWTGRSSTSTRSSCRRRRPAPARGCRSCRREAPEFVQQVTAMMMAGRGDELPVSAMPADGTYPSGTTQWEKRNISDLVPVWKPEICIQCGNCAMVCPHAVIRARYYDESALAVAPAGFASAPLAGRGFPNLRFTLQVAVEDCTGCELCVEVCPARSLEAAGVRAINMEPKAPILERERRQSRVLRDAARQSPGGSRDVARPRDPVPDAAVRVSRARAPAAAKRRTCSCSPSSSAIGCWSRMRPAAPPSTAATCRRRRGR